MNDLNDLRGWAYDKGYQIGLYLAHRLPEIVAIIIVLILFTIYYIS